MVRSFLSSGVILATATVLLLAAAATPASGQPMPPAMPSAAPKPKQYPELEEVFQRLLQDRDIRLAISSGPIARTHPELPSPYVLMYHFLTRPQVNQPNAARFQLEEATRKTPGDPEPWIIVGNIAVQERRFAEATMDFDKAKQLQLLAVYPNSERKEAVEQQMLSGMAQLAESREYWAEAEAPLRELLKLTPEDPTVYQRLAKVLSGPCINNNAYRLLKAAKRIDCEDAKRDRRQDVMPAPEAIMAQFYELYEGPQSTQSEVWYRGALKAWPDDRPTRQVVALWALEKGRIDFAKEQVEAVLKIEAAEATIPANMHRFPTLGRMLRGLIALWEKNWQKAEDNFQKAVLEDPNDLIARNNLALALVEQDDPVKKQRALDYAMANYRDRNNTFNALWTLGWVYFRRNEFDQAAFALELAARTTNGDATNADTATYQAHSLYQQGKKWQAKEVLAPLLQCQLFCMKPEALKLYEKVKDAKKPDDAEAARLHEAKATATRFLEAFRKGDNEAATRLLTKVARRKVEETGRCVAPPANKDAKFEVDDAVYPTPDHDTAHVPSRWIAPDDAGKRRTDRVTWICRWEPEGWRVAAFDAYVFEGERPLHLTFEDPDDLAKKQDWLRDEIKRRGQKKPSPADEKKPK